MSDLHRIVTVEAAGAQIQAAAAAGLFDAFNADMAEAVGTDEFRGLLQAHPIGDQFGFVIDVRTEMAGVGERRRGDAHVHFRGACVT